MANPRTIFRMWHAWTAPEQADVFESMLSNDLFPSIAARKVDGLLGMRLLRHPLQGGEVEFVTILQFDNWEAIHDFAGEDIEAPYFPEDARKILSRYDPRVRHYVQAARLDM